MGDTERLLRRGEVLDRTALSTSSLYALMGKGEFPRPRRIGKTAVAWRESEVAAWIESREEVAIGEPGA